MLEPVTPEQLPKGFQIALGKTKSVEIAQTEQPSGDSAPSLEELACRSILGCTLFWDVIAENGFSSQLHS